MRQIDTRDLRAELCQPNLEFFLIDVRSEEDFKLAHITGAIGNSASDPAFLQRMLALAPNKGITVCVYGSSSASDRTQKAAEMLEAEGYGDVLEYREGIVAWLNAGGPVVTLSSRVSVRAGEYAERG